MHCTDQRCILRIIGEFTFAYWVPHRIRATEIPLAQPPSRAENMVFELDVAKTG